MLYRSEELSKIYYEEIKKWSTIEDKGDILTIIMDPGFDEHYANLIKVDLLEKYIKTIDDIKDNFNDTDSMVINYCYHTSVGKEATYAKKKFQRKLVQKVAFEKYEGRSWLFEEDAGESYSRWCAIWAKDVAKNFQLYFGKDPCRWIPKIREKLFTERAQAEKDKLF